MLFQPTDRLYMDESKARGYYVVVAAASVGSIQESEKALRSLLKQGQRRIHFKSERDSRRRKILSRMTELDLRVAIWVAKGRPDKEARDLCIAEFVTEACRSGVGQPIIERDESLMDADRKIIANILRQEAVDNLQYQHVSPHEHPLLWVSDAVGWCYSRGDDWMRRAEPLVEKRHFRL